MLSQLKSSLETEENKSCSPHLLVKHTHGQGHMSQVTPGWPVAFHLRGSIQFKRTEHGQPKDPSHGHGAEGGTNRTLLQVVGTESEAIPPITST